MGLQEMRGKVNLQRGGNGNESISKSNGKFPIVLSTIFRCRLIARLPAHSEGTLTRGMLVLDHRASSKSATSITSRTGQTNRALAIEEHHALDVPEVEARRAEKKRKVDEKKVSGARVVVSSPGSEVMRREMLERVWGVKV